MESVGGAREWPPHPFSSGTRCADTDLESYTGLYRPKGSITCQKQKAQLCSCCCCCCVSIDIVTEFSSDSSIVEINMLVVGTDNYQDLKLSNRDGQLRPYCLILNIN